jgi:hypothetical protein
MRFLAVWHHGLATDRFRADYLSLEDLNRLRDAGFWVGFHGHTHRGEVEIVRAFSTNLPVVAVGSLSAHSKDRPGAVGNQLSIVELDINEVRVSLYGRSGDDQGFDTQPKAYYGFPLIDSGSSQNEPSKRVVAELHECWEVDTDGVAHVTRKFHGVTGPGELRLGGFRLTPYQGKQWDDKAYVNGCPVSVHKVQDGELLSSSV